MRISMMLLFIFLNLFLCTSLSAEIAQNNVLPHLQEISREYYQIATHLEQINNKNRAKEYYKKAIELDSSNSAAHAKLASLYYDDNSIPDALTHFNNTLISQPNDAHILFNIGQCYIRQQQWRLAFDSFNKTILHDPQHERAHIQLGVVCEKLKLPEEAIAMYKKAIEINPHSFEAHHNLGTTFKHLEQLDAALASYRHAHTLQPDNVPVMMDLANTLNILEQNQESLELYEKIVEQNPRVFSALYNFGFTLKKMGHLGRAAEVYHELLKQKPDYAPAHFSLSTIYLTLGDLERGWEEYEWRWKAYHEEPRAFAKPRWHGEDIVGRTLFVYAEQGLGDTAQFIRYLKLLKQNYKYTRIIFESQDALIPLLKLQPYIDQVVSRQETPSYFHYHIPLMSLPHLLKTRLDTIPDNTPYIEPSPHLTTAWKEKLASDKNFKIGLCWQGNARYTTQALRRAVALKSIHLEQFAPLFAIPGVSIYSLQQYDGLEQINVVPFKEKLITFDSTFDHTHGRFMDTAAVIKNLDLVISVDTSICHLAGAMNVPTWVLVPFPADWRWLLNRTDSPWYPSIRVFRQRTAGDWQSVIAAVVEEVSRIAGNEKMMPSKQARNTVSAAKPTHDQRFFFEQLINSLT